MSDGPVRPTGPCRSIPTTHSRSNARGKVHIYTGEPTKAIPYIEQAMRLDPGPNRVNTAFPWHCLFRGRRNYETAATCLKIVSR